MALPKKARTKKKVSIYGNGHFIDSEAHEIYSENAIYDIDKNLLQGEGKFTAIIDKNIIKGKDLFVDGNKKVVKGSNIRATLEDIKK